jgi:hypothetical protein
MKVKIRLAPTDVLPMMTAFSEEPAVSSAGAAELKLLL